MLETAYRICRGDDSSPAGGQWPPLHILSDLFPVVGAAIRRPQDTVAMKGSGHPYIYGMVIVVYF